MENLSGTKLLPQKTSPRLAPEVHVCPHGDVALAFTDVHDVPFADPVSQHQIAQVLWDPLVEVLARHYSLRCHRLRLSMYLRRLFRRFCRLLNAFGGHFLR